LIAQRDDQPIEQRRCIAVPNGGGGTIATILVANLIDEVGRSRKTTDVMDQPNRVIDRGSLLATILMGSMPEVRSLLTGC
jgi:hypothetical protein